MKRTSIAATTGLAVLAGWATATAVYAVLRLRESARGARSDQAFAKEAKPEGARLLVVGDGSAVGHGASTPGCSLPGLLSRANPSLTVVNRAESGAGFAQTLAQLEGDARFDAVLVMVGSEDVLRIHRLSDWRLLRDTVGKVAQEARRHSDVVVFLPPGNLGNLRFMLPPWRWLVAWRSRRLQALVCDAAQANGAACASFFRERDDDPFARHPQRLRSAGGVHPNDAGWELWQRELETQVQLSARLRRIGRSAASRSNAETPVM